MRPLIIVAGPTGSGKTGLAVQLALAFNGEIVSADSMQIYKGMDIGTAKASAGEMRGVPHHMLDVARPSDNYSAAEYQRDARKCIDGIYSRNKIPILAGGTGLYINSVIFDMDFGGTGAENEIREKLNGKTSEELYAEISAADPQTAAKLTINDRKRIIRALEIYYLTGVRKSEAANEDVYDKPLYDCAAIYLKRDRTELYEIINKRVDVMLEQGLADEVKSLLNSACPQDAQSMQAIGYKEIIQHLNGELTLDEAAEAIKRNTRRYAKRQETWFKRYSMFHNIDMNSLPYEHACDYIARTLDLSGKRDE